jgi:hypothetical protein
MGPFEKFGRSRCCKGVRFGMRELWDPFGEGVWRIGLMFSFPLVQWYLISSGPDDIKKSRVFADISFLTLFLPLQMSKGKV